MNRLNKYPLAAPLLSGSNGSVRLLLLIGAVLGIAPEAQAQCEPADTQITSPADGASGFAPATFTLSATRATGSCTIKRVDFRANGSSVCLDTTSPFSCTWSGVPAGTYSIVARSTDSSGYVLDSEPITVTSAVNQPPTVTFSSPAAGEVATAPATFTLRVNPTDSDGTIRHVDFKANGVLINTDSTSPFEYVHGGLAAGSYSFEATAYDDQLLAGSSTVSVISNAAPTVSLTSPANGATAPAPATFTLTADAADVDGSISRVEFYSNGALINSDAAAPFEYVFSWLPGGTYSLTAKAYDNHGATQTSAASTISVSAPTVSATRSYVYDAQQRLCKIIEPETGATVLAYDGAGNLWWSASGLALPSKSDCDRENVAVAARKVVRGYDARNRLDTLTFPDGKGNQSWVYWPDGLPKAVTTTDSDSAVINRYEYNKRRLLEKESIEQTGVTPWSFVHGYDVNAHESTITYPSGLSVDYAPNALGQPTQVGSFATEVTYHPNGAMKRFKYGNQIVHTLAQNLRQLPLRSLDALGTAAVLDDTYAFDRNGNVASITDGVPGNRRTATMGYDTLDRLRTVQSSFFGSASYYYDGLDNIRRSAVLGRDHSHVYDSTNRLTRVSDSATGLPVDLLAYDSQGNLNNRDEQGYQFDFGNRLRSVSLSGVQVESYRYDALGRRVRSARASTADLFGYSYSGKLLQDESSRKGSKSSYVYLNGSLLAQYQVSLATNQATVLYQHTDSLGTPVAVTDASGSQVDGFEYEPYGAAINRTVDGVGYTGHVMDAATGLTYMQQRYYDPLLGRFLSNDPVAADTVGGWNFSRYNYAANNPYKLIDPDGRTPVVALAVCAFGGCEAALAAATSAVVATAATITAVWVGSEVGAVLAEEFNPDSASASPTEAPAGPATVDDLLEGAEPIGISKPGQGSDKYSKPGTVDDANKDFDSVTSGSEVKDQGNGIRSSSLPDGSSISVRPSSSGANPKPTIQINPPKGSDANPIKIRYEPPNPKAP